MQREYSPEIRVRLRELAQQDLYQKRAPRADFVGRRFGRLVVERAVGHAKNGRLLVLSHCDCGGARIGTYDALVNGVKSCGCLEEELRPAIAKQRRFDKLLLKTIKDSRTAKPVESATISTISTSSSATISDIPIIDVPAIQAVIHITNLTRDANEESEESEDG